MSKPPTSNAPASTVPSIVMERFRVEVGKAHGVEVADIVGAIASEADIRAEFVGRVDVRDDHSLVELPEGMPKFMLKELRRVWVRNRQLEISRVGAEGGPRTPSVSKPSRTPAIKDGPAKKGRPATSAPTTANGRGDTERRPSAPIAANGRDGERNHKSARVGKHKGKHAGKRDGKPSASSSGKPSGTSSGPPSARTDKGRAGSPRAAGHRKGSERKSD